MQSNIHIHAEYRITLSDYRKAVYCALVIRRHRLFLCMLLILAAAFIYAVGRFSGLFPVCYPLVFVAAAELIWGLVLFAGAEKSVRAYMRTPNNYLGAAFAADFEDLRLHIQSPEHGVNLSIPWTKVYCVLEYSSFFSVYLTPQETCIIPRRALSADDDAALRALFSDRLGKRYTPARLLRLSLFFPFLLIASAAAQSAQAYSSQSDTDPANRNPSDVRQSRRKPFAYLRFESPE